MQSTVTVHTQPSMARPGSPEQWGFGASLASVRPGSPYEQWGSPEQPAAGDSFEQWGYSLASAARGPGPAPGGPPPAPRRGGRGRRTHGRTSGPTLPRTYASRRSRRGPPPSRAVAGEAILRRGAAPAAAVLRGAVGGEGGDRRARVVPVPRGGPQPEKVCRSCRATATEREARRLAHRRARPPRRSRAAPDAGGARGGVLATMLKASDEAALADLQDGTQAVPGRLRGGGAAVAAAKPPARPRASSGPPGRPSSRPCSSRTTHQAAPARRGRGAGSWSGSAAAGLGADGDAAGAARRARRGRAAAGVDAPRRRLAPPRGPPRARRPASRSTTSTRRPRRLEAKHDGAVFAAARLRQSRSARRPRRPWRGLDEAPRRGIQLQRSSRSDGGAACAASSAQASARRGVPGDDVVDGRADDRVGEDGVAPSNTATVASSNSGGHSATARRPPAAEGSLVANTGDLNRSTPRRQWISTTPMEANRSESFDRG